MSNSSKSRKLSPAKARQIFKLYHAKGMSQRHIAAMFGVSRSCVYGVTHGETWTEVTRPLSDNMILRGAVFMD